MSKSLQDEFSVNGQLAYLYPSPILGPDVLELMQAIGRVFGDTGSRVPLWLDEYTTTNVAFTQANDVLNGINLDQREGMITLERDLAGDVLQVEIFAFVQLLELRVHLVDGVSKAVLGSLTLTPVGINTEWLSGIIQITSAQGDSGLDPKPLAIWMEARTTDAEGELWQVDVRERRLTSALASLLP